jgi:hypothetical protein
VLGAKPSDFPHSIYLIGLKRSWIFSEPFHTIPIDCGSPEEEVTPTELDEVQTREQFRFIGELIGKHDDADPPTLGN